ncbi:hypothetical protein CcaCcLH18_11869 [Colletotrichum camelliae]|nr:hypothetical protein CcaCcLH18_11869 [Colletotrichum camelliae]
MSSSSSSASTTGPAPWRAAFLKNVTEMSSPEFYLATLHAGPTPTSSSSSSSALTPRTRTVIFRGLWASLPVNPKNPAPLNPPLYESDLLTLTTDARMAKVPDFFTTPSGSGDPASSGGGAPVEACFWTPARVQWRIRGEAYILGPDISSSADLRSKLLSRMRRLAPSEVQRRQTSDAHLFPEEVRSNIASSSSSSSSSSDNNNEEEWSFAREVTAHFGNLSPMMRGTFRNPTPGTARAANPPDADHKLGQKVDDLEDPVARENFRVVVIVPTEVDHADLSDSADPRRWLYRLVGADKPEQDEGAERTNGWEKIETWP